MLQQDPLKERQKKLLSIIVNTYVYTINPVGSKMLAEMFETDISPATIRNEMHELEQLGYVTHPHTSAGRVPTDKGYRYYVDYLMPAVAPNDAQVSEISQKLKLQLKSMNSLIERVSRILSAITDQTAFIIYPDFESLQLKQIELTKLGDRFFLVVWVTQNGFVHDRVVDMNEDISADDVRKMNSFLNKELCGMCLSEIQSHLTKKLEQAKDSLHRLYELAKAVVSESFPGQNDRRFLMDGSHQILKQPEFQDWEKSSRLLRHLATKESFLNVLPEDVEQSCALKVCIGRELNCDDLWDCSFVTAPYGFRERSLGTLGILGPRRMNYAHTMAQVGLLAALLGETLEQLK